VTFESRLEHEVLFFCGGRVQCGRTLGVCVDWIYRRRGDEGKWGRRRGLGRDGGAVDDRGATGSRVFCS